MVKSLILFLCLQSFVCFAQAQMTSEEIALIKKQKQAQENAEKAYASANAGVSVFSDSVSNYTARVTSAVGSGWTSLSSYVQNKASKLTEAFDDDSVDNSAARKERAERVQAAHREKLKASEAMEKASGGITKATDAAAAAFASAKTGVSEKASAAYSSAMTSAGDAAMAAWIKSFGLTGNYETIRNRYSSTNDAMVILERTLDRSVMAAYMQEKMRKMLSSDVMCKATSSCKQNGNNSATINSSDMKSIFPTATESAAGSSAPSPAAPPVKTSR